VIARVRSGAFPEDWSDREARRQDQDYAERQAAARERAQDRLDVMRLHGEEPPTLAESIAMRAAATFTEQDRRDRIRDKAMLALGEEQLAGKPNLRAER
jgi:hypothetical protein